MAITTDYFSYLPGELTTFIASHLAPEDLLSIGLVSKTFERVVGDNALWPLPKALTLLGKPRSHKEAVVENLKRCCRFLRRLCQGDSVAEESESLSLFQADQFLRRAILRPVDRFPFELWLYYSCPVASLSLPITREHVQMVLTLGIALHKEWVAQVCASADIPKILIEEIVIQSQYFLVAPDTMRADSDFVLRFIRSKQRECMPTIFIYLSDRLKRDFEVVRELLLYHPSELRYVDSNTQYIDPKTGETDPLSKERYAEIVQAASQGTSAPPGCENAPRSFPNVHVADVSK